MSRSFRKNWFLADTTGTKYRKKAKRWANKAVKHSKNIPNGKAYKKLFQTYDICDFKIYWDNPYNCKNKKPKHSDITNDVLPFWVYRNK